jgi:hypothetical protein
MKRVVFVVMFLITLLNSNSLFDAQRSVVLSVDLEKNEATIKKTPDMVVGASGVVMHHYDKYYTIIARAIIKSIESETATIEIKEFTDLIQPALAKSNAKVAMGDEVRINYLYNRAIIISPNFESYYDIVGKYDDIEWIHPDIVAAKLLQNFDPDPNREIFENVCIENAVSLLYFAIKDKGYFVDCHSFAILKSDKIKDYKNEELPFYTRVSGIETSWLNWGENEIQDYNRYYKELLGIK